jgi:hypothetical protein
MGRSAVFLLLGVWLAAAVGFGQLGVGTITGRVTDTSGAVVPDAQITIVNTDTNFTFTSRTNSEGLFRVPSLQPGPYRVTVEAAGFTRFLHENVLLRAGDTLAVNTALSVGAVTETVAVTAAAPLLQTETSATGTAVEGRVMYNLPMYQRNVAAALTMVPGLTTSGYVDAKTLGNFNVAGQRRGTVGFFEDGVVGQDQFEGVNNMRPILNAVAEVKVLTSVIPAEYGHSAGGIIDAVKKTGTNEFHGMASMFGRSRIMQHRLYFDQYRTSDPQPGNPNGVNTFYLMPDANVGGPIRIPKVYDGRNKTFFFWAWQKQIEKKVANAFSNAPTPDMKRGDFSFGGLGNPLYDPASTTRLENGNWARTLLPNNLVPLSRFDPVARKILDIDPWVPPNKADTPNAAGPVENIIYNEKANVFREWYNQRFDHQFNSALKAYFSYSYAHIGGQSRHPRNVRIRDFDGGDGHRAPFSEHNFSLGKTWIISPTMVNDARIGYYRRHGQRFVDSYGEDWPRQLGIPNIPGDLMPSFGTTARTTAEGIYGLSISGPSEDVSETRSFRNDFTVIRGTHSFKMGYEFQRLFYNSSLNRFPSGDFRFDAMTAGLQANGQPQPRTGFLLGYVRQATFTRQVATWLPQISIQSFYFQDDWKVTPTLTFNLGVRYTNESPYNTKWGQHSVFDPTSTDPVTGRAGAIVQTGQDLSKRDNNNWQPRVGVAWHPWAKWVFRAGFGVNTIDTKVPANRILFDEYEAIANYQQAPGDPRPLFRISEFPEPPRYAAARANGTTPFQGTNFGSRTAELWDPNLRNAYAMNWNFNLQRALSSSYVLNLIYQGSAGVGLIERWQYNTFPLDLGANDPALRDAVFRAPQNFRPFPHFGDVNIRCNCGHSTYHAGTVQIEKRYSSGLLFSSFYTFSKAIDSQDTINSGAGVAPLDNRNLEKALAGFNRKHRFVATGTYDLPMGRGKKFLSRGGWWNHIFGGYSIGVIQVLESGNPLNFTFANSPFNYYPTFAGARRPDAARPNPKLLDNWRDFGGDRFSQNGINPVIDINNFAYPAAFTPGNLGRNVVTGFPTIATNLTFIKEVPINERFRAQLRLDMMNAFHNYNFNTPTNSVDFQNPRTFGKVRDEPRTSSVGGQPLMDLTLAIYF